MTIKLYANRSENTKLDKNLSENFELTGSLKERTDLLNPTILVQKSVSQLSSSNYVYIPEFHRYYFITKIESVTNNISAISMRVDVLTTYKDEIRSQSAIINRGEKSNIYNLNINDGSIKTYQDDIVITRLFPNGFTHQDFILCAAG